MPQWKKHPLTLKDDHTWKAKPGYRIFVADRGAVRFDIPEDWVLVPGKDSFSFHDRQPPKDDCRLEMSYLRLPPLVDWSKLPLSVLFEHLVDGDPRAPFHKSETYTVERPDLELVWVEIMFIDPAEKREARSRLCLARAMDIQPCITMDFWPEDAERVSPVWDEVLRSLQLGVYVKDPTRGKMLH
jgi:hypothetical protein